MRLNKGTKYDQTTLRHYGWMPANAEIEGYNCWDYFDDDGRYLGPDQHGVEPEFEIDLTMTTQQVADAIGVTLGRVHHRLKEIQAAGLAEKRAGRWFFNPAAVDWWKDHGAARNGMGCHRIDNGNEGERVYTISGMTIRGFDWTLVRSFGQGTYARFAGSTDQADDVEITVEEHAQPEYRRMWDEMPVTQAARLAYEDIQNHLGEETE